VQQRHADADCGSDVEQKSEQADWLTASLRRRFISTLRGALVISGMFGWHRLTSVALPSNDDANLGLEQLSQRNLRALIQRVLGSTQRMANR